MAMGETEEVDHEQLVPRMSSISISLKKLQPVGLRLPKAQSKLTLQSMYFDNPYLR